MTTDAHVAHRATIEQLAEKYRRDGYQVVVEPGRDTIPELVGYRPDLVATKGDEHQVVEVVGAGITKRGDGLSKLAAAVESRPGWHFRIVFVPRGAAAGETPLLRPAEIRQHARAARQLAHEGLFAAAILVGWSIFEASAYRRLVLGGATLGRPVTPAELVRLLIHHGHLAQDALRGLNELTALRNAVAHGHLNETIRPDHVERLLAAVDALLDDTENAA